MAVNFVKNPEQSSVHLWLDQAASSRTKEGDAELCGDNSCRRTGLQSKMNR